MVLENCAQIALGSARCWARETIAPRRLDIGTFVVAQLAVNQFPLHVSAFAKHIEACIVEAFTDIQRFSGFGFCKPDISVSVRLIGLYIRDDDKF